MPWCFTFYLKKRKLKYGVLIYRSTNQFSGEGVCVQEHLVCLGQNRGAHEKPNPSGCFPSHALDTLV